MADKPDQNWERRDIDSRGSKFRIDVNNPQTGARGPNAWVQYGVTDDEIQQFTSLSQEGTFMVHNERTIEIVAGSKNSSSDTGIKISSAKGDITITVVENGDILIKGGNIALQADGDIDLKAGKNISLNAGQNVTLKGIKASASALLGNLVHATGSWIERIYAPTYVGADYLKNPGDDDQFISGPVVDGIGSEDNTKTFQEQREESIQAKIDKQYPGGRPEVQTTQTTETSGNTTTTTTTTSADDTTKEGSALVDQEKADFEERMAARRAARGDA